MAKVIPLFVVYGLGRGVSVLRPGWGVFLFRMLWKLLDGLFKGLVTTGCNVWLSRGRIALTPLHGGILVDLLQLRR